MQSNLVIAHDFDFIPCSESILVDEKVFAKNHIVEVNCDFSLNLGLCAVFTATMRFDYLVADGKTVSVSHST